MKKIQLKIFVVTLFILLANTFVYAQATSNWILVSDSETPAHSPTPVTPTLGGSYVTVEFLGGEIYQRSNWWTNLVERNRVGVIDVKIAGRVNNRDYEDIRASPPIELRRNDSQATIGWRQIVVRRLPTVYQNLRMNVRFSKSSKDGLQDLLTTLTAISNQTPSLQVSQSAMGIVSGSKAVVDFLFNQRLLVNRLESTMDFPDSGLSLRPGTYVVLAADDNSGFNQYLTTPASGRGLSYNDTTSQLSWDGRPLSKVSFFVVRVKYDNQVFAQPLDSLSFSSTKPWASLYQIAQGKINTITAVDQSQRMGNEITNHLANGNSLLDNDPDYIQSEKNRIKDAVLADTQRKLNDRLDQIISTSGGGGGSVGRPGIVLAPQQ